jgi:hypothetical protein
LKNNMMSIRVSTTSLLVSKAEVLVIGPGFGSSICALVFLALHTLAYEEERLQDDEILDPLTRVSGRKSWFLRKSGCLFHMCPGDDRVPRDAESY